MKLLPQVVIILLALFAVPAFPYGLQRADSRDGEPLRWAVPTIRVSLSTSFASSKNVIGAKGILGSLERAAARWEKAGSPKIRISSTDDSSISPSGPAGDGVSLVTIAQTPENLVLFSGQDSRAPAFTRVFFDRQGRITEADIVLNPFFLHSTNSTPGTFDLESTFVHELGHLLGLGHSDLPGASMHEKAGKNGLFGVPFTMYRSLSQDDIAGMRALYQGSSSGEDCCSSVEGRFTANTTSMEGVILWAEDHGTGAVEAAIRASETGVFDLSGLEGGSEIELFARTIGPAGRGTLSLGSFEVLQDRTLEAGSFRLPFEDEFRIERVGFNGELADIAIPLNAGNTYRIYAAGSGDLKGVRFELSSPAIVTEPQSYEISEYGSDQQVISFLIDVGEDVPAGIYSIRAYKGKKLIDSFPGAVSIGEDRNPWIFHRLP